MPRSVSNHWSSLPAEGISGHSDGFGQPSCNRLIEFFSLIQMCDFDLNTRIETWGRTVRKSLGRPSQKHPVGCKYVPKGFVIEARLNHKVICTSQKVKKARRRTSDPACSGALGSSDNKVEEDGQGRNRPVHHQRLRDTAKAFCSSDFDSTAHRGSLKSTCGPRHRDCAPSEAYINIKY